MEKLQPSINEPCVFIVTYMLEDDEKVGEILNIINTKFPNLKTNEFEPFHYTQTHSKSILGIGTQNSVNLMMYAFQNYQIYNESSFLNFTPEPNA